MHQLTNINQAILTKPSFEVSSKYSNEYGATNIELLEVVNQARALHGEGEIRRNDFTDRCMDELAGEDYETFVVGNPNGTQSVGLRMTRDQCMYVLMRESKAVRRTATEYLNKPAKPAFTLPDFTNPAAAARAWADAIESSQALVIERDHAIATKAHISDKKTATAMATASAKSREVEKLKDQLGFNARHATVISVEKAIHKKFGKQDWRPLKAWCKENGASSVTVPCARYGKAQAWPAGAWGAVYGVDLTELFGEATA